VGFATWLLRALLLEPVLDPLDDQRAFQLRNRAQDRKHTLSLLRAAAGPGCRKGCGHPLPRPLDGPSERARKQDKEKALAQTDGIYVARCETFSATESQILLTTLALSFATFAF